MYTYMPENRKISIIYPFKCNYCTFTILQWTNMMLDASKRLTKISCFVFIFILKLKITSLTFWISWAISFFLHLISADTTVIFLIKFSKPFEPLHEKKIIQYNKQSFSKISTWAIPAEICKNFIHLKNIYDA